MNAQVFPTRIRRRAGSGVWGVIAVVVCTGSAFAHSAGTATKAERIYSFADSSGRQELRIVYSGPGTISFSFERSRSDGCAWHTKGSAHRVGSREIEGEDGYPIFFNHYRNKESEPCQIYMGIEERTAARAQLNAGGKCGPTCPLDDPRSLMTLPAAAGD
jgi:hypothetical protein